MGTPPIPLRDTGGEGYKCASNILNSSIAVPRSFMGCCTQQNIEEVARSDGRVENSLSSAGLYRTNHIFTIRLGDPLQEQPIQ